MQIVRTLGDVLRIVGIAAVIGAMTGLITSLTRSPNRVNAAFGMYNRVRKPTFVRGTKPKKKRDRKKKPNRRTRSTEIEAGTTQTEGETKQTNDETRQGRILAIDLGSLGPMLVGAGGAVFVVFASGVASTKVGHGQILDAISDTKLMILAITGGAAGELVFRTLASGGKVPATNAQAAVTAAGQAAGKAVAAGADADKVRSDAITAGTKVLTPIDAEQPGSEPPGQ